MIPALTMALYSGHVIDISEKRNLLLKTVSLYTLCAGILLFLSTPFIHDHISRHQISIGIYSVIFCTGIIRSFTGPNFTALIGLSLIHISEPTRLLSISYAVFCLKKKKKK